MLDVNPIVKVSETYIKMKAKTLDEIFGADKGRIKPFSEEDRGEDRN
jgi:hypothetical protein